MDDTPPPPSLNERKAQLQMEVRQQEQERLREIMPPGRYQLLTLQASPIMGSPDSMLTEKEKSLMARYKEVVYRRYQTNLRAAEIMAEIGDLTEETIGHFVVTV